MESLTIEIFEVRASLYGLLAKCLFSEPSSETLKEVEEQLSSLREKIAVWDEPELEASFQDFLHALAQSNRENLAVDYTSLFLGGKEGSICPSESSYVEKIVYGQSTLKVIEFYAQYGFIKDETFHEPDDHIAVEFAFMSVMGWNFVEMIRGGRMESSDYRNHLEPQLHFLTGHLLKWVPAWATHVRESSETDFYRTLAKLSQTLVEADCQLLRDTLRIIQNYPRTKTLT
jgi:TorA maturation chaperone TorD